MWWSREAGSGPVIGQHQCSASRSAQKYSVLRSNFQWGSSAHQTRRSHGYACGNAQGLRFPSLALLRNSFKATLASRYSSRSGIRCVAVFTGKSPLHRAGRGKMAAAQYRCVCGGFRRAFSFICVDLGICLFQALLALSFPSVTLALSRCFTLRTSRVLGV